jgi:hypothetical protein
MYGSAERQIHLHPGLLSVSSTFEDISSIKRAKQKNKKIKTCHI